MKKLASGSGSKKSNKQKSKSNNENKKKLTIKSYSTTANSTPTVAIRKSTQPPLTQIINNNNIIKLKLPSIEKKNNDEPIREDHHEKSSELVQTSTLSINSKSNSDLGNEDPRFEKSDTTLTSLTLSIQKKPVINMFDAPPGDSSYQLDKRQRFEIYKRRLTIKPPAKSAQEAVELINKTLDEIEEKYAPSKDDRLHPISSKKYGRMYPVPKDRIIFNESMNRTEMLAVGLIVFVYEDGSFEMWSVGRGGLKSKKLFFKNGC